MATKTYTLTEDAEGHKIRKCSEYVITDEAGKVKAVSLLALDGTTPIPLNKNFTAVTSPIVAQSYATLISNASQVTDKKITISTESAKMLAEYCRYTAQTFESGICYEQRGIGNPSVRTESESYNSCTIDMEVGDVVVFTSLGGLSPRTYIVEVNGVAIEMAEERETLTNYKYKAEQKCVIHINSLLSAGVVASAYFYRETIADANAKGFKVCTEIEGESYELLPSLSFDGSHYVDSGIVPTSATNTMVDFVSTKSTAHRILSSDEEGTSFYSLYKMYRSTDQGYSFLVNTDVAIVYHPNTIDVNVRHLFGCIDKFLYLDNQKSTSGQAYTGNITTTLPLYIGSRNPATTNMAMIGKIYSVTIDDALFIPAKLGTQSGMLNLTDKTFHPLTSI